MPPSTKLTPEVFVGLVRQCGLIEPETLRAALREIEADPTIASQTLRIAEELVSRNLLTRWQADKLLQGRHKGFFLGKYRLLSHLGSGGMSAVYLAEHRLMRRRVAIKVLPRANSKASSHLERFHREAQAVAALDHRNIVRAYDVDQEGDVHFLVMEYVAGRSLHEIVAVEGPMEPIPAAEYIRQAAEGLNQAHKSNMVHRDIKPGNLLLDDRGTIKVLDLGLAKFFNGDEKDEASVTKRHDEKVLGTADYLSPEQALDSHTVDVRSDIYSLGCTLYFLLVGRPPFNDGTLANRLLAHQTKTPDSITVLRPEVPGSLTAIIEKMMQKDRELRYQSAREVANALADWLRENGGEVWAEMNPVLGGAVTTLGTQAAPVAPAGLLSGSGVATPTAPRGKTGRPRDRGGDSSSASTPSVPGSPPETSRSSADNVVNEGAQDVALSQFLNQLESSSSGAELRNVTVNEPPATRIAPESTPLPRGKSPLSNPPPEPLPETREISLESVPGATPEIDPTVLIAKPFGQSSDDAEEFDLGFGTRLSAGDSSHEGDGGEFTFSTEAAPQPTTAESRNRSVRTRTPAAEPTERNVAGRPVWLLALVASGVICLLAAVGWTYYRTRPKGASGESGTTAGADAGNQKEGRKKKGSEPGIGSTAPLRRELKVGPGNEFSTLTAALADARQNGSRSRNARQTIVLQAGQVFAERIVLEGDWPRGIQIICPGPQPAVLSPPGGEPIVDLNAATGSIDDFKLSGVRLDATGKDVAVRMVGFLEAAQLIGLEIVGARKAAVELQGTQSFGNTPILLDRVVVRDAEGGDAVGVDLASAGENACSRIRIRNCRMLGPLAAGVSAVGTAIDLEIEESIFHRCRQGLLLRGANATWRNLLVAANTFHQNDQAIQFVEMPGPATNGLGIYNNLFVESQSRDLGVGNGFKEREFLGMFASNPGGIAYNWTTRSRPAAENELPSLCESRQGKWSVMPQFLSTDPASPEFLAPAPRSPQGTVGIAEALVPLKRFGNQVGAVRPRL